MTPTTKSQIEIETEKSALELMEVLFAALRALTDRATLERVARERLLNPEIQFEPVALAACAMNEFEKLQEERAMAEGEAFPVPGNHSEGKGHLSLSNFPHDFV